MLRDWHAFNFTASVPWPHLDPEHPDWATGVVAMEIWLNDHVGRRLACWAWNDSGWHYRIGVAFRWDQDRLLFVMTWS